jgi:hypothetical protein
LPDETTADVSSKDGTYETGSVQEFADWDCQFAIDLWDTVVWLRYSMKQVRELVGAMRDNEEPSGNASMSFLSHRALILGKAWSLSFTRTNSKK